MKCNVLIENLDRSTVRLTIDNGQDKQAQCRFDNLAWVCTQEGGQENTTSFIADKEKVIGAIKTFRATNPNQGRRGAGLWKDSPYRFLSISTRFNRSSPLTVEHGIGEYQDAPEVWGGYKSRAEKLFDKPVIKIDKAERI